MSLFKSNTDNNSFILTYQKDKPELFIESVNQYVEHVQKNPSFCLGALEEISFCNESGDVTSGNFRETKAIAMEVGRDKACQGALTLFCRTLVDQIKKQEKRKRNFQYEYTHGEDFMFGLIEMGRGEHFIIIEQWVGLVDWHFACHQYKVVYGPISKWGVCIESYRIMANALIFNSEQWSMGNLELHVEKCNPEELALFFKATKLIKEKLYDQEQTIKLNELLECILSIQSGSDHSIDTPAGLLLFKLVVSLVDSKQMLRDYFKYYVSNVWSWIDKDLSEIEVEFDWWLNELEGELFEEMQKLKSMFLQIKNVVDSGMTKDENLEKIEAFIKTENIDDVIVCCYKKLL